MKATPSLAELAGDAQLVVDRVGNALGLAAVAEGGVEDLDAVGLGGNGHGGSAGNFGGRALRVLDAAGEWRDSTVVQGGDVGLGGGDDDVAVRAVAVRGTLVSWWMRTVPGQGVDASVTALMPNSRNSTGSCTMLLMAL